MRSCRCTNFGVRQEIKIRSIIDHLLSCYTSEAFSTVLSAKLFYSYINFSVVMNLFTQCPTTHNKKGSHRYALTHLFFSIKYS